MQEQEKDYKQYNAEKVLEKLNEYIDNGCSLNIYYVCDKLSIFDWWVDKLSIAKMKQMRTFLKNAIRLGFTGYACFKVGASGCSNGMWVNKRESTNGYSPDGDFIYRSFTPDYTYYDMKIDGKFITDRNNIEYDSIKTIKQLEKLMKGE